MPVVDDNVDVNARFGILSPFDFHIPLVHAWSYHLYRDEALAELGCDVLSTFVGRGKRQVGVAWLAENFEKAHIKVF